MEVSRQNPFGIHYLKFVVTLGIIGVHSFAWIALLGDHVLNTDRWGTIIFGTFLCSSMLVPITAGATQGILLRDRFVGGRLRDFSLRPTVMVLAGLVFIESFKAALIGGPEVFFGWNVLHMIAVSLIIVLWLARHSIWLVWLSAIACVAVTPALRAWAPAFEIVDYQKIVLLNEMGFATLAMRSLCVLVGLGFGFWLAFVSKFSRPIKLRLAVVALLAWNLYFFLIPDITPNPYFIARLINLPVGALVGDHLALHYWALFPWYSNVAAGFAFYVWLSSSRHPRAARAVATVAVVASLVVYYTRYIGEIVTEIDPQNVWSQKLFAGHLAILLYTLGLFGAFALISDALSTSRRMEEWSARFPSLWRVPFVFSKSIFWIYIFVNTIGLAVAYPFAKLLPLGVAIVVFPLTMIFASYWLGEFMLEWVGKKRIQIRVSRVRPAETV